MPPKPEAPRSPPPPPSPSLSEELDDLNLDELRERGEEEKDDDLERHIANLQQQRLEELTREDREARFGRVYPISREDYTREVTDASKEKDPTDESEEGYGTGVVCFLYKPRCVHAHISTLSSTKTKMSSHPASERTFEFIRELASRYAQTKFVSIVGDKCIPNYPDHNLPTLILYRNGKMVDNLVAWGANEKNPGTVHRMYSKNRSKEYLMFEADLETVLLGLKIVQISRSQLREAEAALRAAAARAQARAGGEDDEDSEDDINQVKSFGSRSKGPSKKIRGKTNDDSDSDFDL